MTLFWGITYSLAPFLGLQRHSCDIALSSKVSARLCVVMGPTMTVSVK